MALRLHEGVLDLQVAIDRFTRFRGLKPDEIVLEADIYSLTASTAPAQTEPKSGRKYIRRESSVRPMSRVFNFPVEIDSDNVQANLERGILQIRVPKATAVKRKLIRVGQAAWSARTDHRATSPMCCRP